MSATVKLDSVRFVKRVSSGGSLSKYGYIGMMERNALALQSAPWAQSNAAGDAVTLTTNKLTKTDGVWDSASGKWTTKPTYTAYMGDQYDAFAQAGDAIAANATMCGYAGCVAYRFALPESESANPLEAVSLVLQRDRYLRAGVRVALALSNSETPSDDWSVVRGEAAGCVKSASTAPAAGVVGVASFGFLGQPDVANVVSSRAASDTLALDTATAFASAMSYSYLYVYVTLEDAASYWDWYSQNERRQYYIEGSAMLIADSCAFTFTNAITEPTPAEIEIGFASVKNDNNSLLLTLSQDLQPHPAAATDLVVISRCGAPVLVVDGDGNTVSVGMSGFSATNKTLKSLGDGTPEDAVRAVYAEFYNDNLIRCPYKGASSVVSKPAASFSVSFMLTNENTQASDAENAKVAIHRKKVLVPFTIPMGFTPSKLRLDWTGYAVGDSTSINADVNMRHNVWLAPGRDFTNEYGLASLKRHELYTAETSAVDGFVLLGSFMHKDDGNAVSETVDIPVKLDHGPHTLLLTLFIDQDQLTFGEGGTASKGAADDYAPLGVIFGRMNPTVYGNDNTTTYGGGLSGGWAPTMTLIG